MKEIAVIANKAHGSQNSQIYFLDNFTLRQHFHLKVQGAAGEKSGLQPSFSYHCQLFYCYIFHYV